jgi:pimeloyl-ACP methyl ester carboxylesterase
MTIKLTKSIQQWQAQGQFAKLAGHDIFYHDTGTKHSDAIVLLHGFPSSSYDWHLIFPLLGEEKRIICLDFLGFGLSDKPKDHSYSLMEQADIVELLLKKLGIKRAKIIAHDMATSVTCELLARRERQLLGFTIQSVLLMNGSVYIDLAQLTPVTKATTFALAEVFAKISLKPIFMLQLKKILAQPVSKAELDAMWALLKHKDGKARLAQTISYIDERYRFAHRWLPPLTRLDIPVLVLWGKRDPVAIDAIAEKLSREIPTAKLQWLYHAGHYPQLEDPVAVAEAINLFLA